MKFNIVEWMAKYGHTSYRDRIWDLQERIDLTKAEAGRNWQYCEYTLHQINKMDQEIQEIEGEAEDRYNDWVSDQEI